MKLAYGTYATPMLPMKKALSTISETGYEGVELCVGPKHIMPENMNRAQRQELKKMLSDFNLEVPSIMTLGGTFTEDKETHKNRMDFIKQVAELARDLEIGEPPVISSGLGGKTAMWDTQRDLMVSLLGDYVELAEAEDFILAGEEHANAMVDRTERAVWLMKAVDNPRIRLHFDIVHTYMAGDPITESVRALVPYTAHTHITDVKLVDGKYKMVLVGEGELDCVEYVKAMHDAGWTEHITVEVSTSVWSREDFDPIYATTFAYETLDKAFREAGVPRT